MSQDYSALGLDIGSTTVKAVLLRGGRIVWRDYQRHYTRQAETVLGFLERLEHDAGLRPGKRLDIGCRSDRRNGLAPNCEGLADREP